MGLTPLSHAAGPSGAQGRKTRDRLAFSAGSGRRGALLLGAAILFALPGPLAGQGAEGDCDVPDHQGVEYTSQSNGFRIALFFYPTIRCSGGTWINADSARVYEFNNYSQLFGNVIFRDADTRLTADEARYFSTERRLRAWGNAVLTDQAEGSEFRGDTMVLLRAGPNREVDELTVTGSRPHATLYPSRERPPEDEPVPGPEAIQPDSLAAAGLRPDSAAGADLPPDSAAVVTPPDSAAAQEAPELPAREGEPPAEEEPPEEEADPIPYEIDAQRFFLQGTGFFIATGGVLVRRDSLDAVADSLEYEKDSGALFLIGSAGVKTASYDLGGEAIRLDIPRDEIRHVDARGRAILEGEDLRLLAPAIVLFLNDGQMERLVAMEDTAEAAPDPEEGEEAPPLSPSLELALRELGLEAFPARPFALAEDFEMEADSIEVLAPEEVLNQVLAMGDARGVSFARDSLNRPDTPEFMLHDWLEGDTIVATFSPTDESEAGEAPAAEDPEAPMPVRVRPGEAAPDSAGRGYRLERLVARVGARSLYRMEASDSTVAAQEGRMAVHYVLGQEITIIMSGGEVERMEVSGPTVGLHGEPTAQRRRPDTLPDTTRVETPPDTASPAVGPAGGGGTTPSAPTPSAGRHLEEGVAPSRGGRRIP